MAFTLQAFVGDSAQMKLLGVPTIVLPQSKALIPLTKLVRDEHDIPPLPLTDEGSHELPEAIAALASRAKRIAYVEAEYFGGVGTQAAAIWEDGRLVFGPVVADDAISQALRQLGVSRDACVDEFDALQLGRCRAIEDWR